MVGDVYWIWVMQNYLYYQNMSDFWLKCWNFLNKILQQNSVDRVKKETFILIVNSSV